MKIYENVKKGCHEELRECYPVWYREVREMDAVWGSEGAELDRVRESVIRAVDDCFALTASEQALSLYEEFLDVNAPVGGIAARRAYVASCFIAPGHVGEREIKEIARAWILGAGADSVTVSVAEAVVTVTAHKSDADDTPLAGLLALLVMRLPAHLRIVLHVNSNVIARAGAGAALRGVYKKFIVNEIEVLI